jgi:hypothetical protein
MRNFYPGLHFTPEVTEHEVDLLITQSHFSLANRKCSGTKISFTKHSYVGWTLQFVAHSPLAPLHPESV